MELRSKPKPKLPNLEDINKLQSMYVTSKMMISGRSSLAHSATLPSFKSSQSHYMSRTLGKSQTWFQQDEKLDMFDSPGAKRFTSKPLPKFSSTIKLFPTYSQEGEKLPSSTCPRFGVLKPESDKELIDYIVSGKNAFTTSWIKHRNLKDRKFFPELHPEWQISKFEYNLKRDRIVQYREEMLQAKNMTSKPTKANNKAFK